MRLYEYGMSQPPFVPGQVHTEDEFEQGPDADLAMPQGDPNWNVPEHNPATFGASADMNQLAPQPNPLATAEEASRIAGAALHICDANHINLQGKLYLKLEAWQAIAAFAGTKPSLIIVKDNVLGGVAGITARVGLKNAAGKLLSEAEGFVGNDEPFWNSKPMSDRQNMAQTRAAGRVFRLSYSYIVQLMNKEYGRAFEVTPAEEMLASQSAAPMQQMSGLAPVPPQPGQRHVFQPIPPFTPAQPLQPAPTYAPMPAQPPQNVVYPSSHDFQPSPQYGQPNQAAPVGQNEVWQGTLGNVEIKMVNSKRGQSQLFIIALTDGRNASTFDKTIAGHAGQLMGQSVEMLVIPRGQGRYNVGQIRPL